MAKWQHVPLAPQHVIFMRESLSLLTVSSGNQLANMFNKSLKESYVDDICDKLDLRGSLRDMILLHEINEI